MNVYCCQLDPAWENKQENFKRVTALLNRQSLSPGSLLILPEMFATGFCLNAGAVAEAAEGLTDQFLQKLARQKRIFVLGGLARVASQGRILTAAVCMDPTGKRVASYGKLHLSSPADETREYAPDAQVSLFQWGEMSVAVFIGYDLQFPEIFRIAAQHGANVLVVLANWPVKRHPHWTTLLRARAIENQAIVIGVNRCGNDPHHDCFGGSLIVNPLGGMVAEGGAAETLLHADLNKICRLESSDAPLNSSPRYLNLVLA